MNIHRLTLLLGLAAALAAWARAGERNAWPVQVAEIGAGGQTESKRALGPLFFEKPAPEGGTLSGFRPFYVQTTDAKGLTREATVLYPLFSYRTDGEVSRWTVFQLINRAGRADGAPETKGEKHEAFDVWPFWFSHQTDLPETSYQALFPVAGTVKYRFGYDRIAWTLWPLYMESAKHGATTTSVPWPFLRVTHGAEEGFALWPLFGWRDKPGAFHHQYFLWPLIWNNTTAPAADAPAGTPPARAVGFLPFYSHTQRPGLVDENFFWPFFGYTKRTQPVRYDETRYFWPFLVQGRGDGRLVNRWGPFYTHSISKGVDKTWVLWPLFREATWTDAGLTQTKTQLFYFFFWSLDQRSARNPALPHASKTHVWPLFSEWDNGAGRRQFQFPSPLEVFFPDHDHMHQTWTPLFSLYRSDRRAPDDVRRDFLWGAMTWRRAAGRREFHLGPLLSVEAQPQGRRIALANGLLALERRGDAPGWRFFWFDFPPRPAQAQTPSR
jgi:hypothetical protein